MSVWKNKYKDLSSYYHSKYSNEFYDFDKYQLTIDPDITADVIENYNAEQQKKEILKCAVSFNYFCMKYVKITHPKEGLLPFILFKYQKRVVEEYESNRFNIIRKFRQGGLTTVTVLWALWRCMFRQDETIMVVSKSDREAIAAGEIVKRAIDELPSWLRPSMDKNNDHQKIFVETGCKLFFYTVEAARGRSFTYLVIDEAAFIPNMETHWNGLYPTLATGGSGIVISTVNGVGNWYYQTYKDAESKKNNFNIINLNYWEHPIYKDEKWVKSTRAQLGEKGWLQEIIGDFLGSGDTFISPEIINDLHEDVRIFEPLKVLFPEWVNSDDKRNGNKGALHIFKEPIQGREYIIGVDAADGVGEEADNSCFHVIDIITCEQMAEFYSNKVPPHLLSQVLSQVGILYNTALIVGENLGAGGTVLNRLEHDLFYENLYFEDSGKLERAGIKTSKTNRPIFLEIVQAKILTKSLKFRSLTIVEELKHFIYNKTTRKPEAQKGYHDDAIMALSFALYAREKMNRGLPAGEEVPFEMKNEFKEKIYEEIRRELEKGSEDWKKNVIEVHREDDEMLNSLAFNVRRKYDKILKEFGW